MRKRRQPSVMWTIRQKVSVASLGDYRRILAIFAVVIIGVVVVVVSNAATPSGSYEAESGTRSGGATAFSSSNSSGGTFVRFGVGASCPGSGAPTYTFPRMFGATAPWNVPICALKDPEWTAKTARWSSNMWNYAGMNWPNGQWQAQFGLLDPDDPDPDGDYSVPVYNAADATMQVRVRLRGGWGGKLNISPVETKNANDTLHPDATMPFNSNWRPSGGNDGHMVIIDYTSGYEWDLWYPTWWNYNSAENLQCGPLANPANLDPPFGIGYKPNQDLCVAAATLVKSPANAPTDHRTYTGNSPDSTGVGISNYFGLVFPEEIDQGVIPHALKLGYRNKTFGHLCDRSLDPSSPEFGTTCGLALAPAGQYESGETDDGMDPGQNGPVAPPFEAEKVNERRSNTVPQGARLALKITDAQIEAWLDSRGYPKCNRPVKCKREVARVFAVALRDYGWINSITTGGTAGIYISGAANPDTEQKWRNWGIADTGEDLLFGLFKADNMYVIKPPLNYCKDGTTSYYYCHASKSEYPASMLK